MLVHSLCRKCDGTGWILYRSETLDGEVDEAYRLCPNYCTPRRCMDSKTNHPCPRPGTVRYGQGYYCKEHIELIYAGVGVDHAHEEAIHHLRCWLWIAHDRANRFLEMQLSEALGKAETRLRHAERGLDQDCDDAGDLA